MFCQSWLSSNSQSSHNSLNLSGFQLRQQRQFANRRRGPPQSSHNLKAHLGTIFRKHGTYERPLSHDIEVIYILQNDSEISLNDTIFWPPFLHLKLSCSYYFFASPYGTLAEILITQSESFRVSILMSISKCYFLGKCIPNLWVDKSIISFLFAHVISTLRTVI